ncbi:MAG: WD40 repeat domain-containing protein, partial [Planctomycetaceae bacterium]|nr:WD40 repeat domain-containing protein [Planctomycetaceae bacterium]
DPSLTIAEEIKTRGRGLGLQAGQTPDGKRIWATTTYGGRVWDLASGKELVNYYLKFPSTSQKQGSRSPQALLLEARDEDTLVNRGYISQTRLSPLANLLVTRKNLHSDSNSKGRITVYDTMSQKPLWTKEGDTPGEEFAIIKFTEDEKHLILYVENQDSFLVLDSHTGKPVSEWKPDDKGNSNRIDTPAGFAFSSSNRDGQYSIAILSPNDGKLKGKIEGTRKAPEKRNGFSTSQPAQTEAEILLPDGWAWIGKGLLAITEDNLTIKLWDLNQPDFDPAAPHWSGKQFRDWPALHQYFIEVPPDTRSSGLSKLGFKAAIQKFENAATLLAEPGELYHAANQEYLGSLNFKPVDREGQKQIIISDNSGQHIAINEPLILETPQGLRCLLLQPDSPALDQYRIIDRTPLITGVTPLTLSPPNFVVKDVIFNNDNGQIPDNHRKFEFVTASRNKTTDFQISSTGQVATPLMADRSSGLSAAVISVPDGTAHLFKPDQITLLGFCSDDSKLAFVTSNGVSLHNAEDGALLQKVTYA